MMYDIGSFAAYTDPSNISGRESVTIELEVVFERGDGTETFLQELLSSRDDCAIVSYQERLAQIVVPTDTKPSQAAPKVEPVAERRPRRYELNDTGEGE